MLNYDAGSGKMTFSQLRLKEINIGVNMLVVPTILVANAKEKN